MYNEYQYSENDYVSVNEFNREDGLDLFSVMFWYVTSMHIRWNLIMLGIH